MEAKCSKLLYWLKLTPHHPHPFQPSLSTLGGVKSTSDDKFQLNTVWFALSLLHSPHHVEGTPPQPHLLPHELVSSSLPPLSCSSQIPLLSNTREVTEVCKNPTFTLIFPICSRRIVTREFFSKKHHKLWFPGLNLKCACLQDVLSSQNKSLINPLERSDCDVSLLDERQHQGNESEHAQVLHENEPEAFIQSSVQDILFFSVVDKRGKPQPSDATRQEWQECRYVKPPVIHVGRGL